MTLPEYNVNYVLNGYHKRHEPDDIEVTKDKFIDIIRCARQLLNNHTFGELIDRGNDILFRVKLNDNSIFRVHVDTRVSSLNEFYENRDNSWVSTEGPDGGIVLTNKSDRTYIQGFYVYLK
jgi:hypothetical protein